MKTTTYNPWKSILKIALTSLCFMSFNAFAQTDITDLPGTIVIARGENPPSETKEKAYDNNPNTKWLDAVQYSFIRFQITSGRAVNQISLTSANDAPERDPKEVTVQASNDGTNFVDIYTNLNVSFANRFEKKTFSFSNTTNYTYYTIQFRNTSGTLFQVAEIELLAPSGTSGSNNGNGLKAEYFNNINLSGTAVTTKTEPCPNNDYGSAAPSGTSVGADNFSVRWSGQIEAPVSGSYTFTSTSDDGQRVWVNGVQIINDWNYHGAQDASGNITLTAGQKYNIEFEYFEATGGAVAKLNWAYPGQTRQVIPTTRLYSSPINPTPTSANSIGINLGSPADYDESRMFADIVKVSRKFVKFSDQNQDATVDANGWPTEDFMFVPWAGIDRMEGTYKISFNGQATITAEWASATFNNQSYNSATNTTTLDMVFSSTGQTSLRLKFSGTGGNVKNIKMMRPKTVGGTVCYTNEIFTDQFKSLISKYSVIRTLNCTKSNGSNHKEWSDRLTPSYASYQRDMWRNGVYTAMGAPYELIVQLANETNKDIWICVPHMASDDYITQLARLIKNGANGFPGLNSNLKVYFEYSNEVWNTAPGFGQTQWIRDQAVNEVKAGGSNLNFDNVNWNVNCTDNSCGFDYGQRWKARRHVQMANILRTEFGADMMTRVRPIYAWQQGNSGATASIGLSFIEEYFTANPVNYYIYGGSGSAYYNPDNGSTSLDINNFWNSQTMNLANWSANNVADAQYASGFGFKRIAYEGGPSLDNYGNQAVENVKQAAWNDIRMKDEIIEHHNFWSNNNGELLCYYRICGDYQWGFSSDVLSPSSPKTQGIDQLNSSTRAALTLGSVPPLAIDGNQTTHCKQSWKGNNPGPGAKKLEVGEWYGYFYRVTSSGNFNVKVDYAFAQTNAKIIIKQDGVYLGEQIISGSGVSTTFNLGVKDPGLHSIMIYAKNGTFDVVKVTINTGTAKIGDNESISYSNSELNIYPNPATNVVTVQPTEAGEISILNMTGTTLTSKYSNGDAIEFDLSNFQKGIYLVKTGLRVSKLIVE